MTDSLAWIVARLFLADDLKTKRVLFVSGSFADSAKDFVSILANGSRAEDSAPIRLASGGRPGAFGPRKA